MPTYAKPDLGDKGLRPDNGTHYVYSYQHSRVHQHASRERRERSGSVVECLTRDRRAAGSSLTGVTVLCP